MIEQTRRGRMTLVEADSFYLPDTTGTAYRQDHTKSTIAINMIDPEGRRLDYFHNAGFYTLEGEDYDGALGRLDSQIAHHMLYPYVEFIKFEPQPGGVDLARDATRLLRRHLARRAPTNPVGLFQPVFAAQAEQVAARPPEFFHKYAFNIFRQIGANFELLGSHLEWLSHHGEAGLDTATAGCRRISSEAKIMQFQLARAVARKKTEALAAKLDPMRQAYDEVFGALLLLYPDRA